MKKTVLTTCMTVVFLFCTQNAFAGTSVSINFGMIPVVPVYTVCEYPAEEYIWVEGHYCNDQPRRYWVPGHWSRPPHFQERYGHRPVEYQNFHRERHYQDGPQGRYERDRREGDRGPGNYRPDRNDGNYSDSHGKYQQDRNDGHQRDYRHQEPASGNWMNNLNDRVIKRQINTRQASR